MTKLPEGVTLQDFAAHLPGHDYIFMPTGAFWTGAGVNAALPPVPVTRHGKPMLHTRGPKKGEPKSVSATTWLDRHAAVHTLCWAPGRPTLIRDRLLVGGGWVRRNKVTTFNFYRPPAPPPGDAKKAGRWLDLVRKLYPNDAEHIVRYFAHCIQRPAEKPNHGLVLGGPPGVGKDSLIEPVKRAIGAWNFKEVSPTMLLGRFTGFLQALVVRVSELRDLGEFSKYALYERCKTLLAAPPDVLRVDEKFQPERDVLNVVRFIFTSNHLTSGLYLPPDDRRHYVAWTDLSKDAFDADYWNGLWQWYDEGGIGHVAAYLAGHSLAKFDAKAPPLKTAAFLSIVDANQAPEDSELADVLDRIGSPLAVTIGDVIANDDDPYDQDPQSFGRWLRDRKNRRVVPHRFAQCGYTKVRNDGAATDGLWQINGVRQAIYAKRELSAHDQLVAARDLIAEREKAAADAKAKAKKADKSRNGKALFQNPRPASDR
jgi:Family of unknown function (DUF5906)